MDELISGLFGLIVIGAILGVGGLILTSNGVLYRESQNDTTYGGFTCTYFTGTRSVEIYNGSITGCPRFISVGR